MTPVMASMLTAAGCAAGCAVAGRPLASIGGRLAAGRLPALRMALACGLAGAVVGTIVSASEPALLAEGLGLALSLTLLAAIDLAAWRLPDILTLPLAAVGLILAALPGSSGSQGFAAHVTGALVGFSALAATAWAFRRATGRDGLGLGDAKLFGAAGAWLGWDVLPQVLLVACGIGLAWVAGLVLVRGSDAARRPIPFGPAICAGFLAIWLSSNSPN